MSILEEKISLICPVCAVKNGILDSNLDIVPNRTILK